MHFFFNVTIPKDTLETDKYRKTLILSYGVITKIRIDIPAGHKGLAHLQLLYHEFQVYPLSRGEDYHGDNMYIECEDDFPIMTDPLKIIAEGWNEDDTYEHSFLVSIVLSKPKTKTEEIPLYAYKSIEELYGYEGEIK